MSQVRTRARPSSLMRSVSWTFCTFGGGSMSGLACTTKEMETVAENSSPS